MLTKTNDDNKPLEYDQDTLRSLLHTHQDSRVLLRILNNLGRLPGDFDGSIFIPLLAHQSSDVRLAALKNLGKVKNASFLPHVADLFACEQNTLVRREAISAVGRMRTRGAIPFLEEALNDRDPKVVLQAIRALLYFRDEPSVSAALMNLQNHPNELIQSAIRREFSSSKDTPRASDHTQSPDKLKNVVVHADIHDVLRLVPDESVHLTFTSPPYYNARDYTIYRSYDEYLAFLTDIFKEVHRITKEGRFFVLNTSPVLVPRMSRKHSSARYLIPFDIHPMITKLGFDFIEDIIWLKPDPSAKNRNGGFYQHRKPLGYKANSVSEYVIVYRKHTDKLIDWNMRQYDDQIVQASKVEGDYEKTNAWKIAPASNSIHPAIFPKELAARVIQFYSFKGDLVFDPFGGSGTVGEIALSLDRFFFLVEKDEQYINYTRQRLSSGTLFSQVHPRLYTFDQFESLMQRQD
ncbi:MAG: HEAT repeat domain-containing protein [Chloroflexi bacterium]|nr:HEAT repeat domain-containing protein [Chloroflexota bacterium]